MTDPDLPTPPEQTPADRAAPVEEVVLYREPGSTWWPLLWGPLFCAVGYLVEVLTGPAHPLAWSGAAVLLVAITTLWIVARRQDRSVVLTPTLLRLGADVLHLERIVRVEGVEEPEVARPVGRGFTIPRKTHAVPLELTGGTVVLAWARFPDDLVEVLAPLLRERHEESEDEQP
ncbi:hypothetical protein [Actinokineospora pegani]|uniref:hypothetical protein n=1 Tax=Actinokineospora pegani TaxID=2654637 RepID=UPI001F2F9613|nr:hypothetical protein [Actinokineospora pegani]